MFRNQTFLFCLAFSITGLSCSLLSGETALYDGWVESYANGSNRTIAASGLARPGSLPDAPFYRYIDGDALASGVQHFSAVSGIDGIPAQYSGPNLFGGAAYRDSSRPDDSATIAATVLSIRNKPFDSDNGSGTKGDTLRFYLHADTAEGLSIDEGFGAVLFDFAAGAGLTGLSWSGATNSDNLQATVRWAVLNDGTLYLSETSFSVADNGSATQTETLVDIGSTKWASWSPENDIADLKFSSTTPVFAQMAFSSVSKVGFAYELEDSLSAVHYLDVVRFAASKQAVAPVIISSAEVMGNVGIFLAYQIEATDSPTSFGLSGTLPAGLSFDSMTGIISGTPLQEESQNLLISATNAIGTGTSNLLLTIGPSLQLPEITSPATASAPAGAAFVYQIEATHNPVSFSAVGLPEGLSLDTATGLISGKALIAGSYELALTASNEAGDSQSFILYLDVPARQRTEVPGGRHFHVYFLGNSLTLSLTTAPQPELARLERLFAARGNRLVFGATLGAGVNLDQHWSGKLYSDPASPQWMKQGLFDDQHEVSLLNGWAGPDADFQTTQFRDYNFALQGKQRLYDGTEASGHVFDALLLQPYVAYLEPSSYTETEQINGATGDRTAAGRFIAYAMGDNPGSHRSVRSVYLYSVWPQLLGVEQAAIDSDADGVFSFSEFYASPYDPPVNPDIQVNARIHVPKRDYIRQLHDALRSDLPDYADSIFLIPVGEVFAELDRLIRLGQLSGAEAFHNANLDYFIKSRDGEQIEFNFIYQPGQPSNWGNNFIAAQGIKNFYADNIHWNDQTHNDPDSGTLGAYVAAATIQAVLSGEPPSRLSPAKVASFYEAFDASRDDALIRQIQEVIWTIVTSEDWQGMNYAERTGLGNLPANATSFRTFRETFFTSQELADEAFSGPSADPDADGEPNLREFFRQTHPRQPDQPFKLEVVESPDAWKLQFEGLRRPSGFLPVIETSNDLVVWERLPARHLLSSPMGHEGLHRYQLKLPPAARQAQFHRLALPYVPDRPTLPLVFWGESPYMVSANQNVTVGLNSSAVDFANPSNPPVESLYQTSCPVFFAAFRALTDNVAEILRINDNSSNPADGTGDVLLLKLTRNTEPNHGVFTALWRQEGDGSQGQFLNGAHVGNVNLARMSVRVKVGFGSGSTSEMRFVIEKDGQFFISGDAGGVTSVYKSNPGNDTPFEEIVLANPHAVDWFHFDPAQDILNIGEKAHLPDFNGITAVGFNWRTHGNEALRYLYIEGFSAEFYP